MKSIDVKSSTCIVFGAENNDKDPKFEVGDHVRISKYKNILAEVFVIKKVKNTLPWTYVIEYLMAKNLLKVL